MKKLFLILTVIALSFQSCSSDDDNNTIDPVIEACDTPTNLSISGITDTSAVLNWGNSNDITEVKVEYGPAGFTPGNGTVIMTSQNSVSIDGLTPDTSYSFYVQALCSSTNTSTESGVVLFNTDMTPSPFAGTWSGTYAGDDTGTWIMVISNSGTFVSGSAYSNNVNETILTVSATINADGYVTSVNEIGGTSEGQITGDDLEGTWENTADGISGTLIGSRE